VKTFAWKAAANALATEENKLRRNMHVTGFCNICGMEKESTDHALYHCPHAYSLWREMRQSWNLPSDSDMHKESSSWFRSLLACLPDQMIDSTLLVAWRVWHCRNEITHDKPLPSTDSSKRFLIGYWNILKNNDVPTEMIIKGKQPVVDTMPIPTVVPLKSPGKGWSRPPMGWVKLSIDGSYKPDDGSAGCGMVLRDENGHVIFLACRYVPRCVEAVEAELWACHEGL
jgi:hypothetical protein